jgi:hypothetical protein
VYIRLSNSQGDLEWKRNMRGNFKEARTLELVNFEIRARIFFKKTAVKAT